MAKYRVLSGIDYPPNKRAEKGDVVEDLPPTSVKWLLESNIIEPADKAAKEAVVEEVIEEAVEEPIVEAEPETTPAVEETAPVEELSSDEPTVEAGE